MNYLVFWLDTRSPVYVGCAQEDLVWRKANSLRQKPRQPRRHSQKMFKALSKRKQQEFLGHANDVWLFLAAAEKAAPAEETE